MLGHGDIEVQTRTTYENLQRLDKVGCTFKDLVKLNTYLVFDGSDEEFSEFWATMARVRQEFLPEPGPTDMRVAGLALQIRCRHPRGNSEDMTDSIRYNPGSPDIDIHLDDHVYGFICAQPAFFTRVFWDNQ